MNFIRSTTWLCQTSACSDYVSIQRHGVHGSKCTYLKKCISFFKHVLDLSLPTGGVRNFLCILFYFLYILFIYFILCTFLKLTVYYLFRLDQIFTVKFMLFSIYIAFNITNTESLELNIKICRQ